MARAVYICPYDLEDWRGTDRDRGFGTPIGGRVPRVWSAFSEATAAKALEIEGPADPGWCIAVADGPPAELIAAGELPQVLGISERGLDTAFGDLSRPQRIALRDFVRDEVGVPPGRIAQVLGSDLATATLRDLLRLLAERTHRKVRAAVDAGGNLVMVRDGRDIQPPDPSLLIEGG